MRPHPRHTGELGAVGHLVEREPESELARREREPFLEAQDVGTDVVDEVLFLGMLILDQQQVVLAEHPCRHPPEHCAELRARDGTPDRRDRAGGHARTDAVEDGPEHAAERGDIRVHPTGAVGDAGAGGTSEGPQPGDLADEGFRLTGEFFEVRLKRRVEIGVGQRLAPTDPDSDALGDVPRNRIGSGAHVVVRNGAGTCWRRP